MSINHNFSFWILEYLSFPKMSKVLLMDAEYWDWRICDPPVGAEQRAFRCLQSAVSKPELENAPLVILHLSFSRVIIKLLKESGREKSFQELSVSWVQAAARWAAGGSSAPVLLPPVQGCWGLRTPLWMMLLEGLVWLVMGHVSYFLLFCKAFIFFPFNCRNTYIITAAFFHVSCG